MRSVESKIFAQGPIITGLEMKPDPFAKLAVDLACLYARGYGLQLWPFWSDWENQNESLENKIIRLQKARCTHHRQFPQLSSVEIGFSAGAQLALRTGKNIVGICPVMNGYRHHQLADVQLDWLCHTFDPAATSFCHSVKTIQSMTAISNFIDHTNTLALASCRDPKVTRLLSRLPYAREVSWHTALNQLPADRHIWTQSPYSGHALAAIKISVEHTDLIASYFRQNI